MYTRHTKTRTTALLRIALLSFVTFFIFPTFSTLGYAEQTTNHEGEHLHVNGMTNTPTSNHTEEEPSDGAGAAKGCAAGAAVGTAIAPGVGTIIGCVAAGIWGWFW